MTKQEFEARIRAEGLIEVCDRGSKKIYIDSEKVVKNGKWISNETNAFGCYKGANSYIIFMTDDERGIAYWSESYEKESDAYDALYDFLKLLDQIYKEDHGM